MIPDDKLEQCLEFAEEATENYIAQSEIKLSSAQDIRELLRKQYDLKLLSCLQEKDCAQYLRPEDKSDMTTTKIELRKAEFFKKLKNKFLSPT